MYMPVMLDIENKKVIVVGGGTIALRRTKKLLSYGAKVSVISIHFLDAFYQLEPIERIQQSYDPKYIQDAFLVIAATSDRSVNHGIYQECHAKGILCTIADDQGSSDILFPAEFRRGDLIISVSTSGKSPSLSKKIIEDLKQQYDTGYEEKVKILGEIRDALMKSEVEQRAKKEILSRSIEYNVEELHVLLQRIQNGG